MALSTASPPQSAYELAPGGTDKVFTADLLFLASADTHEQDISVKWSGRGYECSVVKRVMTRGVGIPRTPLADIRSLAETA